MGAIPVAGCELLSGLIAPLFGGTQGPLPSEMSVGLFPHRGRLKLSPRVRSFLAECSGYRRGVVVRRDVLVRHRSIRLITRGLWLEIGAMWIVAGALWLVATACGFVTGNYGYL